MNKQNNIIRIIDFLEEPNANTPEQGDKFYGDIVHTVKLFIDTDTKFTISFEKLGTVTTAFLNNSIAKLFSDFGEDKLEKLLSFSDFQNSSQITSLKLSLSTTLALNKINSKEN